MLADVSSGLGVLLSVSTSPLGGLVSFWTLGAALWLRKRLGVAVV